MDRYWKNASGYNDPTLAKVIEKENSIEKAYKKARKKQVQWMTGEKENRGKARWMRMIDKFSGMYTLTCDICGEDASETFDDFYDAVQYKKDNGWKSQKRNGQWEDVCPECQEG